MEPNPKERKTVLRQSLSSQLYKGQKSALQRYKQKAAGELSFFGFLRYELANILFANMGGGIGYVLRKQTYGPLFRQLGTGVIIGRGITFRHPGRIGLGNCVAMDDNVMLDASGTNDEGLLIGDQVILSKNCIIQSKTGPVVIGDKVDVGANTIITSASGIYVESSVLIAGNCYIGGSRYYTEHKNIPIMEQGWYTHGPVHIGKGSWLGAGVIILDGVSIGQGCVVGAGAVVTKDLPDYAVAAGVPAKVLGTSHEG